MALTRDKSEGTVYDPVRGLRGGPFKNPNYYRGTRLISVPNVEYTTLTQCRSWLPGPIGGIVWVALGAQDTSCYVPFYGGVTDIPKSFSVGDHFIVDRGSARWAFDYVDFHTQVAYNAAIEDVKAAGSNGRTAPSTRSPRSTARPGNSTGAAPRKPSSMSPGSA